MGAFGVPFRDEIYMHFVAISASIRGSLHHEAALVGAPYSFSLFD
jgi:hypothetical protein